MKILRWDKILIFQSLNTSLQIVAIIFLDFSKQLTPVDLLFRNFLHKQRVSHTKDSMFEHQFLDCNESTGVMLMKNIDWLTIAFVDIRV